MISIYERKILRSIFGGIQENGTWRRSNLEPYHSYKESDIKVECATPFEVSRDTKSLLFGRSRDYYLSIDPCHHSCDGL
ncbi:hypothetical protein TNCV_1215641 [Trichonephila clavipes]|nr:hypothetical protein TNCV_1215641 [Trichonephila clavipes]